MMSLCARPPQPAHMHMPWAGHRVTLTLRCLGFARPVLAFWRDIKHERMRSLLFIALLVLALVSGGLARSQRLVEQRLDFDGMGASNAGTMRTTGYFKVILTPLLEHVCLAGNRSGYIWDDLQWHVCASCRSTRGGCSFGSSKHRSRSLKSSLWSYG